MQALATQIEEMERALTAPELARLLCCHKATVHRWAVTGILPHFRIGSTVRFDCRAVARFLREHETIQ
jgi:excisionase family DNA binding protein